MEWFIGYAAAPVPIWLFMLFVFALTFDVNKIKSMLEAQWFILDDIKDRFDGSSGYDWDDDDDDE